MHRAPEARRSLWERFAGLVSAPASWVVALLVAGLGGALLGLVPQSASAEQSPVVLPPTAESARVTELVKQFPGGDTAPVLLVISRADGGQLSGAD
ncbi:MAG: MMPL family transporter, partial [Mycobacterium sp.]